MEVIENIKVRKEAKISKSKDESFFTPMSTSIDPYLKIDMYNLFAVLAKCITHTYTLVVYI